MLATFKLTCILQMVSGCVMLAAITAQEEPGVTRLRQYLRLKAVHPEPDYNSSVAWIKNQAQEIGLEYNIKEFGVPGSFAIWLTWKGTDPRLSSILLNSHIDVVPVDESKWTHDPFGAEKDQNGNIFARGSQDMKSTAVQYLEAVRNFKSQGVTPLRNVHISFVPDEEVGGLKGMVPFVASEEFKRLNIGFALDESTAAEDNRLRVVWTERAIYQVEFTATGKSGHGSVLFNNTAAEKIQKIIVAMLELRSKEKQRLETNNLTLGDVTTINLTLMKGGTQANVVPTELSVTFEIRITPYWNLTYVQDILEKVRTSAGPGVSMTYLAKAEAFYRTPLNDNNIWWTVMQTTAKKFGYELVPTISRGGSDARYIRQLGIPAFGFSTITNTPGLAHDNDEFINENIFLNGIKTYEQFLPSFFNLTGSAETTPTLNQRSQGKPWLGFSNDNESSGYVSNSKIRPRDLLRSIAAKYENL